MFLFDIACQKLSKLVNVSWSCLKNKNGTYFFETRCIYIYMFVIDSECCTLLACTRSSYEEGMLKCGWFILFAGSCDQCGKPSSGSASVLGCGSGCHWLGGSYSARCSGSDGWCSHCEAAAWSRSWWVASRQCRLDPTAYCCIRGT